MEKINSILDKITTLVAVSFSVFTLLTIVFVKIAYEILEREPLAFDNATLLFLRSHSSKILDWVFINFTDIGGVIGVTIISLILLLIFATKKQYGRFMLIFFSVGGAVIINLILKALFERTRPSLWEHLVTETSFSFPSGHAMGSCALAASIVLALWYSRWRITALIFGVIYILFVGISRLYLGVHYPTDVIAGWCVSLAWVIMLFVIFGHSKVDLVQPKK